MATSRPFAYNTGGSISGTEQVGNIAIGTPNVGFESSGVKWWNGPDEDLGYVICLPVPLNTQDTPVPGDDLILSSTYKGIDINLINNQTAYQQFGYQMSVLGQTLISGTDKVMFSIYYTTTTPTTLPQSRFIGVGKTTMNYQGSPYGGYPGNDDKSIGFNAIGEYYYNGSIVSTGLPTWGDGDTIDIAISHGQYWWIRVNGGNWNNNPSANPATLSSGLTMSGQTNYYPALCPGYEGTMKVLNVPYYGYPSGYNFLGHTTASIKFIRSNDLTQESFVDLVNTQFNENHANGNDANSFLTTNGYWSSWTGFGSSGFQWMTINSITSNSASGIGQNNITISITQSGGGMGTENGMYSAATFPQQYGVPLSGNQIQNNNNGTFTAVFSQPVLNPLVAFASVGNGVLSVPVIVSAPFTPIWGQATTYQNPVGTQSQYTQFTGTEGFNIIRIDGIVTTVSFNYTVSESYSTICFGFVNQNA